MNTDHVLDAAHAHYRKRFGQAADLTDPTDRELFCASVVEAAEDILRRAGTPGAVAVESDPITGAATLAVLRLEER